MGDISCHLESSGERWRTAERQVCYLCLFIVVGILGDVFFNIDRFSIPCLLNLTACVSNFNEAGAQLVSFNDRKKSQRKNRRLTL